MWSYKNVTAHIWPNDHYPPHVTFVSKDGWSARIKFSMVDNDFVKLWDIKLARNGKEPGVKLINELANQLVDKLDSHCRPEWWRTQQTVCLDNKSVKRIGNAAARRVALCSDSESQGRLVAGSGKYIQKTDDSSEVRASVIWNNGTSTRGEKVEA